MGKSLEMLQTTIEVLEGSKNDADNLHKKLAELQQSILDKENEISNLQQCLNQAELEKVQLSDAQLNFKERISSLEEELDTVSDLTGQLADHRKLIHSKDEEIEAIK